MQSIEIYRHRMLHSKYHTNLYLQHSILQCTFVHLKKNIWGTLAPTFYSIHFERANLS